MNISSQECQFYSCTFTASLPVGLFHTDVEGHYLAVNHRWCEIAGISAAEARGNRWVQVLYPEDRERVFGEWYRAVQENLQFRSEYRFQHPDGKITWVLGQVVPETDKTGAVTGYIGTITDITDSLRASYAANALCCGNASRQRTEEEFSQYRDHLETLLQERTNEFQRANEKLQQEIAERQRVEEALRKREELYHLRNRELQTLHRISEIHLSTRSLKAAFQEIVEEISTATGFPICAIELYDESRQMMVFEAVKGVPVPPNSSVLEVPADQTLSGTVARTGEPAIKIYAPHEPKNCDSNETLKTLGIKTFICIPMSVNGRAIGTLSLAHPEVVHIDEHLPQWIGSLANYIASLTERKRMEEELRESRERLQLFIDYAPAAVAMFDRQMRYIAISRRWLTDFNLEERAIVGRCHYEVFPDIPEHWQQVHQRCLNGAVESCESDVWEQANGNKIWLRWEVRPWYDHNGDIGGIVIFTEDITERSSAEAALRESEEKYRLLFSNELDAISLIDMETRQLLDVNQAFVELYGYSRTDALGMTAVDFSAEPAITQAAIKQASLVGSAHIYLRWHKKKDGTVFPVELCAKTFIWQGRQVMCSVARDITDRYRAEEALRQSEERYRRLIETASEGIWMLDAQNKTSFVNRRMTEMLGYKVDEMLGMPLLAFMDEQGKAIAQTNLERRHQGIQEQHDFKFRRKDGSDLWAIVSATPIFDAAGHYSGTLGMITDITERKQIEEALRHQVQREKLIAGISQRIHQSFSLEEILNTTVAEVRQFLTCDRVIIYRLHPDGSGVVLVESVGSEWRPISGTVIHDSYFSQLYSDLYRRGRVQALENIDTAGLTPCHFDLLARFQVKANLVVPIVQQEELWGLLVAQQCSGTRQWQPLDIDLLKSLATQAGIAMQKSELYEQAQAELAHRHEAEAALRQQFLKERLMTATLRRIRQSLDLEDILNTTVAEVQKFLRVDRVLIYRLWSNGTGSAVTEAVVPGLPAVLGRIFPEEVFPQESRELYSQGRILAIADIENAEVLPCLVEFVQQFGVKAKLVVPILQEETLWGLLVAHHCSNPRHWQPLEIDLLKQLATQVGIAIQQSQLYKQTQHHLEREQALNRVIQSIRNSLDLTTIFSTAVSEVAQLLKTDRADIMQYLPDRKVWRQVAKYPRTSDSSDELAVDVLDDGNEIAAQLKRLEIVRIEKRHTVGDDINRDIAQNHPGAWLLVPLHVGSSVWGSLSLMRNARPFLWQGSEVELACAIADQLAIAIQQSELYQQSRTATATALTKAQQLEQALGELQRTQAQLVQSEKMSSLGQLVAGVAHEINNPVTFISANLAHAENYTQDILNLIELYQQQYPNPTAEISSEIEAIDLEFLVDDLPKLLGSMKVGADRICEIISALRNFSRHAEAEIKAVDIHEGIDSTLMILQNRLKAQGKHPEIQVIKEYGQLPPVECYVGQLNQVFMNLLSNAIDAIDEYNQTRSFEDIHANPSHIRIHTELLCVGDALGGLRQVAIRIADNGPGMTEQVKARIFDPFFTTKPVGAGTGLGLSISYQIVVEKHRGQLSCTSVLSQGTEFVIQIPIQQNPLQSST